MKNILIDAEGKGLRAEVVAGELGHIWSHLLQRGVTTTYRSIGFCAIGDDEGSNTLAANLAIFLGGKGKRVALVEATLRLPVLSDMFQCTGSPGLAECLAAPASGAGPLRDAIRNNVAPGVDLVPAGAVGDPFWSFTGERFEALVKDLRSERDVCLVDVPGLNRAPEAALVIRSLDAIVLVVQANRHQADVVRRNVAQLRSLGTPFLGAVMTELVYDLPTSIARIA